MSDYIRNEFVEESTVVIRAGKKGQPQTLVQGGAQATGAIDYATTLQVEGDTDVLNGVYVKYTAAASAPTATGTALDPILINIKVSVTLTLDEAATVLNNAGAPAAISVATYSNVGGTDLAISYDTNTVVGNTYTVVAAVGTPDAATLLGGQDTPTISLTTDSTDIALTQAGDQDFTLPSGVPFQQKVITMSAKGAGNAVISVTSFTDGSTVTLDTANDYVVLTFIVDAWKVTGTSVATIA
jgi:hypothetical protein